MSKAAEQFLRAMSPGLSGLEPDSHPPGRRRFSRQARLLKHSEFDRTYKGGRRHFAKHMTMFYLVRTAESPVNGRSGPRVGLTVGRALGNAVDRNRLGRRTSCGSLHLRAGGRRRSRRRAGSRARWSGLLWLALSRFRRGIVPQISCDQRLKDQQNDEYQGEDEQQSALGA